jgi:MFS family permease
MKRDWLVPFINVGHFLDHFVMLVYATAVLTLVREWNTPYSEMIKLATGGFIAFGAFAIPAGWLADHWSRYKMMVVFFFGIGGALWSPRRRTSAWRSAGTGCGAISASRSPRSSRAR